MGIALKSGRDFSDHDSPTAPQPFIIINETLARTLYPGTDPVGRGAVINRDAATIVGVVADVRQSSLSEAPVGQFYVDLARGSGSGDELIMRTTLPADSLAQSLRTSLAALDSLCSSLTCEGSRAWSIARSPLAVF